MTAAAQHRRGAAPVVGVAEDPRTLDRDIWRMAWPAMLSFMLTNVVDLIDVAFVGRLGRVSIAAYGYSAQYFHLVNMLVQSVGIGCVALMSRAIGAGDVHRARQSLAAATAVALVAASGGTLVAWTMPGVLLGLLDGPHGPGSRLGRLGCSLVGITYSGLCTAGAIQSGGCW